MILAAPLVPALLGELEGVLQPAAARQDVGIVRVIVPLTRHRHAPQPVVLHTTQIALTLIHLGVGQANLQIRISTHK